MAKEVKNAAPKKERVAKKVEKKVTKKEVVKEAKPGVVSKVLTTAKNVVNVAASGLVVGASVGAGFIVGTKLVECTAKRLEKRKCAKEACVAAAETVVTEENK